MAAQKLSNNLWHLLKFLVSHMVSISQKLQWQGSKNSTQLCPGIWWMESSWDWHFKCFSGRVRTLKMFFESCNGSALLFCLSKQHLENFTKSEVRCKKLYRFFDFEAHPWLSVDIIWNNIVFSLKQGTQKKFN